MYLPCSAAATVLAIHMISQARSPLSAMLSQKEDAFHKQMLHGNVKMTELKSRSAQVNRKTSSRDHS